MYVHQLKVICLEKWLATLKGLIANYCCALLAKRLRASRRRHIPVTTFVALALRAPSEV